MNVFDTVNADDVLFISKIAVCGKRLIALVVIAAIVVIAGIILDCCIFLIVGVPKLELTNRIMCCYVNPLDRKR